MASSGPRVPHNYLSFPINGMVHHSTENVWPWLPCGSHDQGRVIVPAVYVEGLFRRAPVNDPSVLAPVKLIEKCLGVPEYLGDALELLTHRRRPIRVRR